MTAVEVIATPCRAIPGDRRIAGRRTTEPTKRPECITTGGFELRIVRRFDRRRQLFEADRLDEPGGVADAVGRLASPLDNGSLTGPGQAT